MQCMPVIVGVARGAGRDGGQANTYSLHVQFTTITAWRLGARCRHARRVKRTDHEAALLAVNENVSIRARSIITRKVNWP